MAVDMAIAEKAEVFVGNGVSSFSFFSVLPLYSPPSLLFLFSYPLLVLSATNRISLTLTHHHPKTVLKPLLKRGDVVHGKRARPIHQPIFDRD